MYATSFTAMIILLAELAFMTSCLLVVCWLILRAIEKIYARMSRRFVTRLVQTTVRVIADSFSFIRPENGGVTMMPNDLSEHIHELHDGRATFNPPEFSAHDPDPAHMVIHHHAHSPSSSSDGWEMDSPGGRHSRQVHARKRQVSNLWARKQTCGATVYKVSQV